MPRFYLPNRLGVYAYLLLFALPVWGAQPSHAKQPARPRTNIILISVDTLRSDHLSCYVPGATRTPNIDKLARGGTTFEQVNSVIPLTLPSHASTLTSTYPFANGVQDNGDRLPASAVTLAGTLHSHGYQTAAFLGGFVLDRRFGLDQGFDTYEGPQASLSAGDTDPGDVKRKGDAVTQAGEAWLSDHGNKPFFLFLHLYDLHTPYNLSAAEQVKYGSGYNGELNYVDQVFGSFWDYLASHDLVENTLVVFTSDHGEGLGEHGESTHGFFVYQSTLHVPLLIHWPADTALLAERVNSPASLIDLSPTILEAVHLPIPEAMQGKSLLAANTAPRDVFSESIYPQKHFDASALASLRSGRYKYIEAPRPEFYDLSQDPNETNNLYGTKASLATAYQERVNQLRKMYKSNTPSTSTALSPDAVEKLHALGYLTGSATPPAIAHKQVDPKDRIADFEGFGRAISLASAGRMNEANSVLKAILANDANLLDVRLALGLNDQRMGLNTQALEAFQSVLTADPANALAHLDAGLSHYNLHQFAEADRELNASLAISPGYEKAEVWLAKTLMQEHEYARSAAEFNQVLQQAPESYEAHDGLGTLAALQGNWNESVKQLEAAIARNPAAAETHNTLGSVYAHQGNTIRARHQFEEALRLEPDYASAHYNLGLLFVELRDAQSARSEFQKALAADPASAARQALARLDKVQ